MGTEIRDANQFQVSGSGLEVTVSPGGNGVVAVGYLGAEPARTFRGTEILGESGSVGPSVSVVVVEPETGRRTTLTVLLPRVRVRPGEWAPVHTIGITTEHASGPGLGQLDRCTVVELSGTASFVGAVVVSGPSDDRPTSPFDATTVRA